MSYSINKFGRSSFVFSNGFNPLTLNPIAWYDSKDLTTLTIEIDNTISQWRDKSGLNYHLDQSVGSNRPTYSVTNGVVFDGNNDYLNSVFTIGYSNIFTIFIVYKLDNISKYHVVFEQANAGTIPGFNLHFNSANGNTFLHTNYGNGSIGISTIGTNDTNRNIWTYNTNGSVGGSVYKNNQIQPSSYTLGTQILSGIQLGRGDSYCLLGNIKELVIFNYNLNLEQNNNVYNYLNAKY